MHAEQLNAARGRLRTIIFRPIYDAIKKVLRHREACCDKVACDYQRCLLATEAWPLEELGNQQPINVLLDRLATFRYDISTPTCNICNKDYNDHVKSVVSRVRASFDGLCLDCMNASMAKTGNSDKDYWKHAGLKQHEWVEGCRVEHKEPTWYFSFMGRREERDRFRKENPTGES